MGLTGQLREELPSASAAQSCGDSDRRAAAGLGGLGAPGPAARSGLPSQGSGFLRMLFGLFPGYIPYMWKIEIAICSHDNDADERCCSLYLQYKGPFKNHLLCRALPLKSRANSGP